jgi:hypothetical protein
MKSAIAAVKVQPYGKAILNRFPAMLKTLAEYTRSGADSDQSILRCYLPAAAMTNLLMAGELALSEAVNSEAIRAVAVDDQSKPPETIAEKLKRKTTLSFVNEPLDRTMSLLADDLGIKIEILGSDLQLDGITKNQAIRDLNEHDKPANEILRDIMFKANPDGKLVYIVKSTGGSNGEQTLQITTRSAANKRGDKLPDDLATPPEKK